MILRMLSWDIHLWQSKAAICLRLPMQGLQVSLILFYCIYMTARQPLSIHAVTGKKFLKGKAHTSGK